ncbi:hypothetical protein AeRB84_013729, partial [Aphanomyces euteiches]
MHNVVHVDEKWFFVTRVKKRIYVYDDEAVAARFAKSKRFITKVMFLCAVGRPQYDPHKKCVFDGKLGIWPFVENTVAQRSSKIRPKGAPVVLPQSVDSAPYSEMIVTKVVGAINEKFPRR